MNTIIKHINKTAGIVLLLLFGSCASVRVQNAKTDFDPFALFLEQNINPFETRTPDTSTWSQWGNSQSNANDYEKPEIVLAQADSLSKVKNYTEAIALLEKNIELLEIRMPEVWSRLGDNYYNTEDYEKAKICYLKYYDYCKSEIMVNVSIFSKTLSSLLRTYDKLSDYQAAIRVCKENIELMEHHEKYFWNYSSDLAGKYGSLSGLYLFIKEYQLSEQAVRKALNIDGTKTWVKTNLAHALLFQGKTHDAEIIFNNLAQTYASVFLDNFERLEKAQAIPQNVRQDVERIKTNMRNVANLSTIIAQFDSLGKAKNYTAAIALLEKNLKLFESDTLYDVTYAYNRLGNGYYNIENYEKAKTYYLKYYNFHKPYIENNLAKYVYWFSNNLSSLARVYNKLSDYQAAILVCKENIELIERYKEQFSKNYSSNLAGKYGSLSWNYLLSKDYQQAEQAVRNGLDINGTETWIKTNLAHSLLFQRKTSEAETIYNELAQTIYHDNETYASTILDDFEQLEKAQAIPRNVKKDVEKIKTNMNEINVAVNLKNYRLSQKSDVTATISGDTLIISGTGKMADYSYERPPWYSHQKSIKRLVIQPGVTSIGNYAFEGINVESVIIPNSVTSIGDGAFMQCEELYSISIPNSVTILGDETFSLCEKLKTITIPNNVTNIGNGTFSHCWKLKTITIPNNVTSIGNNAFYNCENLDSISIPNSITSIGSYAFCKCEKLFSIIIPNNIRHIGKNAFAYCEKLSYVTIPNSIADISAFNNSDISRFNIVSIDNANQKYASTNGMLFKGDTLTFFQGKDTKIIIPNGITTIRNSALSDAYIASITLPASVTDIEENVFAYNNYFSLLTEINVDANNPQYSSINGVLYNKNQTTLIRCPNKKEGTFIIPDGVTNIGEGAFYYCTYLTSIVIPNSVKSIEKNAFMGCYKLDSIIIPDGVTNIGEGAFHHCNYLTSIVIPNSVKSIEKNAFMYCSELDSIIIPNSVKSIGENAFSKCYHLSYIVISDSVTNIGDEAFAYCNELTSVIIPNSVKSIGNSSFKNCESLTSITIPNSVTSIGDEAFAQCNELASVIIPNSVTSIGKYTFQNCKNLTAVIIPNSVTSIGFSSFKNCESLTTIIIPNSVKSIGAFAFLECKNLTSVIIPNSVKSIGYNAFYGCNNLTSITIPNSITKIEKAVFCRCKLDSIIIPNSVKSIGTFAFAECKNLTSVIIPNSVTSIGEDAFAECENLSSVIIPNNITSIESGTFKNCSKLTSLTIPNSVTKITIDAFAGCSSLTSIINLNPVPQEIGSTTEKFDLHNITFYVPASSVFLYKSMDVWKDFKIQAVWNKSKALQLQIQETDSILQRASVLRKKKKYKESVALLYQNKNLFAQTERLPILYDSLSYYYLFVKDFKQVENIAQNALLFDSSRMWIKKNLAHALLLQGKYKTADNIYRQLSQTFPVNKETYARILLDDLETLENEGIINKVYMDQMGKIRSYLSLICEIEQKWANVKTEDTYFASKEIIDIIAPVQNHLNENLYFSADVLLFLGEAYYSGAGDAEYSTEYYLKSENCFLNAKSIIEKTKGKQNKDYIAALLGLIQCTGVHIFPRCDNYIDVDKGIHYYIEKKDIEKIIPGEKRNVNYYSNLKRLGELYSQKGDYSHALDIELQKKEITAKREPSYSRQLYNIGVLYEKTGDYGNAEKYYLEAKNFQEKNGDKSTSHALLLNKLGVFYAHLGDYANAEKYNLEAKNIFEKNNDEGTSNYANLLKDIGVLYSMQNNYDKAKMYLIEATSVFRQQRRYKPSAYALSLGNLGDLYYITGEYSKAETYYLEQEEILEKVIGKEHADYAVSLAGLGNVYDKLGDYNKSEEFYLDAKEITGKTLGKEHPYYIESLRRLCNHYQNMKEYEKATEFEKTVCEQMVNLINQNFSFLSEQQRNMYWKSQSPNFESSYSLSWFYPVATANGLNYNNTLFTKGILLRTNNQIRDAIYNSGNQSLMRQFEQLGSLRQQITVLQSRDSLDLEYVQSLESRADNLDKALTQASVAFRDLKADMSVQWQDIQKQLKSDEVAIEFVHFRLFDKEWTDSTFYAALILRQGMKSPTWIPLCEQRELQSVLQTASQDTQEQTETLYSDKGAQLYQLVWSALEKELPKIKNVYYSPSGLLHKIAFNALPSGKDSLLLSDKYNMHLVSSTREIARLKKETSAAVVQDTTVVYGGLTYDVRQSSMVASAKPYKEQHKDGNRYIDRFRRRDAELPDANLRSGFSEWQYLSGTKTETERIVGSLSGKRIPHQYYTENKGNEESFKYLSGTQTGVIHLATHGFFLPDAENRAVDEIVQRLGGSKEKPFENPLLRSGLIMAGANNQWLAKEYVMEDDIEDGILTADEISRLNLTKTKLVVLSACETGLGDVKNSEGVFGLQRAFKLAGVESLIMSLWKVPDDATAELMTTFYDEWLAGNAKQKAFKTAQQKVRAKYKSPYYWAAFVMMD